MAEGILKRFHINRVQELTNHDAAKATLERAGLQVKGVMQVMQNIEQLRESIAHSDLPRRFQNSIALSGFEYALRAIEDVPYAPMWRPLDFFHAVHARTGSTWSAVMEYQRAGFAPLIVRSSTR